MDVPGPMKNSAPEAVSHVCPRCGGAYSSASGCPEDPAEALIDVRNDEGMVLLQEIDERARARWLKKTTWWIRGVFGLAAAAGIVTAVVLSTPYVIAIIVIVLMGIVVLSRPFADGLAKAFFSPLFAEYTKDLGSSFRRQEAEPSAATICPSCQGPLRPYSDTGIFVEGCQRCGGLWLPGTAARLFTSFEAAAVHVSRLLAEMSAVDAARPASLGPCPHCSERLRMLPAGGRREVLGCSEHGFWLACGQLEVIQSTLVPRASLVAAVEPVDKSAWVEGLAAQAADEARGTVSLPVPLGAFAVRAAIGLLVVGGPLLGVGLVTADIGWAWVSTVVLSAVALLPLVLILVGALTATAGTLLGEDPRTGAQMTGLGAKIFEGYFRRYYRQPWFVGAVGGLLLATITLWSVR